MLQSIIATATFDFCLSGHFFFSEQAADVNFILFDFWKL